MSAMNDALVIAMNARPDLTYPIFDRDRRALYADAFRAGWEARRAHDLINPDDAAGPGHPTAEQPPMIAPRPIKYPGAAPPGPA